MTSVPRRMLIGMGSLLLAAALATGSGANFQSSSASTGNIIKAGLVDVTSTSAGTALLNVSNLAPGHSAAGTVDITNAGDLAAVLRLSASNVVDTPASPALSGRADVKVEDLGDPGCTASCPASSTVFSGRIGALSSAALGTWAVGEKHRFRFTVSLADGGLGAENAYQGDRTTLDLTWSATQA